MFFVRDVDSRLSELGRPTFAHSFSLRSEDFLLSAFFFLFPPFFLFSSVVFRRLALSHTIPFYESVNNLWTTFPASISRRDAREEKFGPSCCRSRTGSSICSDEMCVASTKLPTLLPQEIGNFWTARLGRSMRTTWLMVTINLHGQLWLSLRVL